MSHYILLRHVTSQHLRLSGVGSSDQISISLPRYLFVCAQAWKSVPVVKQHSAPVGSFLDCLESSRYVGMVGEWYHC